MAPTLTYGKIGGENKKTFANRCDGTTSQVLKQNKVQPNICLENTFINQASHPGHVTKGSSTTSIKEHIKKSDHGRNRISY